jgi:hypothetical protein
MRNARYQVADRTLTPAGIAGHYNNFYEFTPKGTQNLRNREIKRRNTD